MAEALGQVTEILGQAATSFSAVNPTELNRALQAKLADLQATIPPDLAPQITPLLTQLYARMTDRALALIPPPMPRTPRKPA
jgi:hypothetical protein